MAEKRDAAPDRPDPNEMDRRKSLKRLAAIGGGTIAASALFGGSGETQPPAGRPRRPEGRRPGGTPSRAASAADFAEAFRSLRAGGHISGDADDRPTEEWAKALDAAKLVGPSRSAAVQTLVHGQRGQDAVDLGEVIGGLLVGFGLATRGNRLAPNRPGMACGGGCEPSMPATIGAGQITVGFKGHDCGGDCGDVNGERCGWDCNASEGDDCGGGCIVADGAELTIDVDGVVLGRDDFVSERDLLNMGVAMQNAAQAYAEVFG